MKVFLKKIAFILVLLTQIQAMSQIEVQKLDGTPINEGDVFLFNTNVGDDLPKLTFKVLNTANTPTRVKLKCVSMSNTAGGPVKLCFGGFCVFNSTVGASYPNVEYIIDGNSDNGNNDHFLNNSSGLNPMENVEYAFKFYQHDINGVEVGNSVSFGYRYNPNLGVANLSTDGLKNFGVALTSNSVQNLLEMLLAAPMTATIFDVNGRILATHKLGVGHQNIDVAAQSAGLYMIQFTNEAGQNVVAKWIKK